MSSTKQFNQLPAASGVDATVDLLAIWTDDISSLQSINRNTFLGITGSPIGTTDPQSLSNKTIGNTNTVTLKDTLFTLQDDGDTTKQAKFQLSGITTATTRTYTLPNASSTLADIATAQTFTNKTLTSPTISGGTIDNSTVTVDSISGHTSGTVVTVANLQISNGVLNTSNSVITANIADTAVTPAKLQTGTGSSWAYQSWTPTWANASTTTGTVVAHYIQTGKQVDFWINFTLGASSTIGSGPTFTLPVTASSTYPSSSLTVVPIGKAALTRQGTGTYPAIILLNSTTIAGIQVANAAGTYAVLTGVTATIPATWANTDIFSIQGRYEAA